MIARLEGTMAEVGADHLIVNVGGVGFRVFVPEGVRQSAGSRGAHIRLYTHLHVRENEIALYGCASQEQLELFHTLLKVSGIGPRMALSILSSLSLERLRAAVTQERADLLAQVPGVGPKTARRIIFQLKDKLAPGGAEMVPALTDQDAEIIAALTTLGYSVVEAQTALQSVPRDPEMSLEEGIRLALAYFGR